MNVSMSPFTPENWSRKAGSTVPSRVNLLILYTQTESSACSRDFSQFPRWRLYTVTILESFPILSCHTIGYRLRSLPRGRRRRASNPQGNSRIGCCLFRCHHGPFLVRLSFLTSAICTVEICDIQSIGGMYLTINSKITTICHHISSARLSAVHQHVVDGRLTLIIYKKRMK